MKTWSPDAIALVAALLALAFFSGWTGRPVYDRWAFDRYARALCADGKVTTYIDHQIKCGTAP